MNLLFVMSAAGSVIVLLYMILKRAAGDYLSAKWKCRILKIALFFYLCPFQFSKIYFQRYYYRYWRETYEPKVIHITDTIQIIPDAIPVFSFNMTYKYLYLAGLVIVFILLCYGFATYRKQKNNILAHSRKLLCENIEKCVKQQAEELNIKRKVACRYCKDTEPVSVGILHPVIILNEEDLDEHVLGWILKHELLHIKNHDVLVRVLSMIVFAVNFYNPLAFYLFLEIISISELVCDETVTAFMNEEERKQYCKLLFETACKKRQRFMLITQFNNQFKLKERIEIILKGTAGKSKRNAFAIVIAVFSAILTGILSVAAYVQPQIIDLRNISESEMNIDYGYDNDEVMFLVDEGVGDEKQPIKYMNEDEDKLKQDLELELDGYFVDNDGKQYQIELCGKKGCTHQYNPGRCYRHEKNGADCTYYMYRAKRCTKCAVTLIADWEYQLYKPKCPHHR